MQPRSTVRDSRLIDALEALPRKPLSGTTWRAVPEGRDPVQCSASGGRWDDSTFDVLYTSLDHNGAIAEMYFHLMRGQPIFPSKIRYALYELRVELSETLCLSKSDLVSLGLDISRYGQLSYQGRTEEYFRTQEIAEVAHFLNYEGLVVPNARWPCDNLIVFCDCVAPEAIEASDDSEIIDWMNWQKTHKVHL